MSWFSSHYHLLLFILVFTSLFPPAFFLGIFSRISSNSLTISDGEYISQEGLAILPLTSMVNHSCAPNCIVLFQSNTSSHSTGKIATVRNIRPIKKGEGLTIAYVEIAQSYGERQAVLQKAYNFQCTCQFCTFSKPPAYLLNYLNEGEKSQREAKTATTTTPPPPPPSFDISSSFESLPFVLRELEHTSFSCSVVRSWITEEQIIWAPETEEQQQAHAQRRKEWKTRKCTGILLRFAATPTELRCSLCSMRYQFDPLFHRYSDALRQAERATAAKLSYKNDKTLFNNTPSNGQGMEITVKTPFTEKMSEEKRRETQRQGVLQSFNQAMQMLSSVCHPHHFQLLRLLNEFTTFEVDESLFPTAFHHITTLSLPIYKHHYTLYYYPHLLQSEADHTSDDRVPQLDLSGCIKYEYPLLPLQYVLCGKLAFYLEMSEVAMNAYKEGIPWLKVTHGLSHEITKEAIQSYEQAQAEHAWKQQQQSQPFNTTTRHPLLTQNNNPLPNTLSTNVMQLFQQNLQSSNTGNSAATISPTQLQMAQLLQHHAKSNK